jgi:hypothetical protein
MAMGSSGLQMAQRPSNKNSHYLATPTDVREHSYESLSNKTMLDNEVDSFTAMLIRATDSASRSSLGFSNLEKT